MSDPLQTQRADKWLHHVRVYKTRTLATQACTKGNVTLDGQPVKAARNLRVGDVVEAVRGDLRLRLRVLDFPKQRIGPPRVKEFVEDLTPAEWLEKAAEIRREKQLQQPEPHEALTKPNKQQLRQLREWWEQQAEGGAGEDS